MDAESTVRTVLRDLEIDTSGITGDTRLREDMQVDSTELVEIAVALARSGPLAIETNDILALTTFADLVTYVDKAPRLG
jgi:acyl carrier protein